MTVVYKMAGVRFEIESECTQFAPDQRPVYESEGAASSTLTWTYEPHGGSTRVAAENEDTLKMPVLRKLGSPS